MGRIFLELLGRQPGALLFDLDGTLVDSVPDIAVAVDALLREYGFGSVGEERVRQWVGNGAQKLVERALAFSSGSGERAVDHYKLASAYPCFLAHYRNTNGNRSRLYPGVREALQAWRQRDLPMAIVTNKPIEFVPHLLSRLDIADYFAVSLGGGCVPQKKPDPAMLITACERLGITCSRCVMIGDSRNDVEAARRAGMPVVAVSYGYNYGRPVELERPDAVVGDLCELVSLT